MVPPKKEIETPGFAERRRWSREEEPRQEDGRLAPPVLRPLHFSTANLELHEQVPAWQEHVSSLVDVRLPDDAPVSDGFAADHTAWNLDGMLVVQQNVPAHRYTRSVEKLRSSSVDHWYIAVPRTGQAWTEVNGRVAECRPGGVELRSLGFPFSGRTTGSESLVIYMPRELFSHAATVIDANNNAILSGNFASVLIDYIGSVESRLPNLVAEDLPRIVNTTRDMILACLSQSAERNTAGEHLMNVALMERARQHIQRNLGSRDLTPAAVCRELGISRTRLYQLFEPSGGVLHYIQRRRLLTAHAALSDQASRQRIGDIAEAVGFSSSASFSRAFSSEFGYSPREARDMIAPALLPRTISVSKNTQSFEEWLKMLGS
jgi:AraC-like DNA-binding protein